MDESKHMKVPNKISKPPIPKKIADKLAELINSEAMEWKLVEGEDIFDDGDDTVEIYLLKGWHISAMSEPDNIVLLSRPCIINMRKNI